MYQIEWDGHLSTLNVDQQKKIKTREKLQK